MPLVFRKVEWDWACPLFPCVCSRFLGEWEGSGQYGRNGRGVPIAVHALRDSCIASRFRLAPLECYGNGSFNAGLLYRCRIGELFTKDFKSTLNL